MNPLEFIYYAGYSLSKASALKAQRALPAKVISVGNITVGGTGKTPATIALAAEASRRGFSPIILTRGYLGSRKDPCFVSLGEGPLMTPHEAGDEPVVMAERLRGVPVVKCADRYEGGIFALAHFRHIPTSSVVFLLDDGFQHLKLRRDIDIVLVDGTSPLAGNRLLPMGSLREPITALRRAQFLVVTKTRHEPAARELRGIHPGGAVFFGEHRVKGFRVDKGVLLAADSLKNASVFAFCGIARPEHFRKTLAPLCAEIRVFKAFRDHHSYSQGDIQALLRDFRQTGADHLVTTEKDAVKLREMDSIEGIITLEIDFHFDSPFFDTLFGRLT